jgi:hypothetical protein
VARDCWILARPEELDDHPVGERRYLAPCHCSACAARILEDVPDDDIVEEAWAEAMPKLVGISIGRLGISYIAIDEAGRLCHLRPHLREWTAAA